MEDNFNQNDFEEFLKEQVKNHRMYPADTVWRDINKKLHGDKKWPALTIAAFTILSATIAISVYFTPQPDIFKINPADNETKKTTLLNSQHNIVLDNLTSSSSLYNDKSISDETDKNQSTSGSIVSSDISAGHNPGKILTYAMQSGKVVISEEEVKKKITGENDIIVTQNHNDLKISNNASKSNDEQSAEDNVKNSASSKMYSDEVTALKKIQLLTENQHIAKDDNDKNMVDDFLKYHKNDMSLYVTLKEKRLKNKFGFQVYLAPSVTYRKLTEDRSMLKEGSNAGPVGLNYVADVNSVVRHRPGNGLEAGVSLMYHLSDKFRIKSGFQFNVRQYSIEAYRSATELASIALIENNRIDTINTLAIYRNSNGYYSTELVNRYYQLAIPVGVEWEIIGNKTIQLNVAGSIQPTYLINRNAYLISTNFKNYSKNPEMVRSFNINSNIETFISFKAGYFKWQIGPQLRYQPYSTFIRQYPIKEHLLDYGIKIGLFRTFD